MKIRESKDLVFKKDEIKFINIIKQHEKMITFDDVTKENIKGHNLNWSQYRISIQNINEWSFWIWKKKSLFNLINH